MASEKAQRLTHLANQLVETLMTAAICAEELRSIIRAELDGHSPGRRHQANEASSLSPQGGCERPIVDYSTLSLSWAGRSCHLGYTVLLRLADRLSRRPNQYIAVEQLLRDVWHEDTRSTATVRSAVRNLRERLIQAGMRDLAAAIRGCGGRYGLILNDRP